MPGTADLCFIVDPHRRSDHAHLHANAAWTVELGPVARHGALGTMTSVYCRDPDGNLIEIATYGAPD